MGKIPAILVKGAAAKDTPGGMATAAERCVYYYGPDVAKGSSTPLYKGIYARTYPCTSCSFTRSIAVFRVPGSQSILHVFRGLRGADQREKESFNSIRLVRMCLLQACTTDVHAPSHTALACCACREHLQILGLWV